MTMIDTAEYYTPAQLAPVITSLAERWAGADHASLSEQRFIQLTEAVLYCTDTALTQRFAAAERLRAADTAHAVPLQTDCTDLTPQKDFARLPDAETLYQEGLALLQTKAQKLVLAYNALMPRFVNFGNRCLADTVTRGYPAFFHRYNRLYAPQDTLLTLDYPILNDDVQLTGLHRVYAYFRSICMEQRFFEVLGQQRCRDILELIFPAGTLKTCVENLMLPIWCRMLYALPGFQPAADALRGQLLAAATPGSAPLAEPGPQTPVIPADHPCAQLQAKLLEQIFGQDAALQSYLADALPGIVLQGVPEIYLPEDVF